MGHRALKRLGLRALDESEWIIVNAAVWSAPAERSGDGALVWERGACSAFIQSAVGALHMKA
jgi:hypothetical protein